MTNVVTVISSEQLTKTETKDDDIIKTALSRYSAADEASSSDRQERLDDLRFRAGEQWPAQVLQDRDADNRPTLVINRLPQFIRLVTNDLRQNRPSITINPTDGQATQDVAEILQGMFRHIEYDSNADCAYDAAVDAAVTHGLGYLRVVTEYEDPMSFDQVIKIKRIRNPFRVLMGPAEEPDFSDSRYGFIASWMSKEAFKATYPDSKVAASATWDMFTSGKTQWITADDILLVEYFRMEFEKKTIWLLDDKTVLTEEQLKKDDSGNPIAPEGRVLVGSRKTNIPVVKWCLMNGKEILEQTDWPGRWIPIIPAIGDEVDVDGEVKYEGIVRYAKDPQRMYNYWASAETETIALAPRAPFIGVEGSFIGHEAKWNQANTRNFSYLEYRNVIIGDKPAPPPSRNVSEPPVRAITQARALAGDDLKATTGTYAPALGMEGNETSGRAILARQQQHGTTNFHYADNFGRTIRHTARIILDLIPKIYDADRMTRIVNPDSTSSMVTINKEFQTPDGVERIYDVRKGRYDVVVAPGPSYATKRQETVATMLQLAQAYPQIVEIAGDLMVSNMDWPGAKDIADRLKAMLPPQLQDTSGVPSAVSGKMEQMGQLIQALAKALQEANAKLESNNDELASKERIALNRNLTDLIIVNEQLSADHSKTGFTTIASHLMEQLKQNQVRDDKPAGVEPAQPQQNGGEA